MKTKLFASLMVLALVSNTLLPIARADDSQSYEVDELNSGESQSIADQQAEQLNALSDSEVQSRLSASADAMDAKASDPSNSPNLQARLKGLAQAMRRRAADPQAKQKLLKGLSRAGETALFSVGILGSTAKQTALLPIALFGGLFEGLNSGEIDKDNHTTRFYEEEVPSAIIVMVECVLYSGELGAGVFALFGGLAVDVVAENLCSNKQSTNYDEKLCTAFKAYDHVIDNNALVGASAVGAGLNRGIYHVAKGTARGAVFLFKGSEHLAHKLFKRKSKQVSQN